MVKVKHTPPAFLQKNLDEKMFAFVKGHVKPFLAGEKVKHKGQPLPDNVDLLRVFIKFLSFKKKAFKGIQPDSLSTTYPGVGQIYDLLRKRNKPHNEEKQASQSKKKPSQPPPAKQAEASKKTAEKDQDAVMIEANDNHYVNGDMAEKNVPYRKTVHEEAELTSESNPSSIDTEELPDEAESS